MRVPFYSGEEFGCRARRGASAVTGLVVKSWLSGQTWKGKNYIKGIRYAHKHAPHSVNTYQQIMRVPFYSGEEFGCRARRGASAVTGLVVKSWLSGQTWKGKNCIKGIRYAHKHAPHSVNTYQQIMRVPFYSGEEFGCRTRRGAAV